jgi:hypothetical protein
LDCVVAEEAREVSVWAPLPEEGERVSKLLPENVAGKEGASIPRAIGPMIVSLAILVVAIAVALGSASPAKTAPTQYFSGAIPREWILNPLWNNYSYNEAFNCWCSGPLVGIKQGLTDGREVRYYTGRGEMDICSSAIYSRTECANLSSGTISLTCFRETGPC